MLQRDRRVEGKELVACAGRGREYTEVWGIHEVAVVVADRQDQSDIGLHPRNTQRGLSIEVAKCQTAESTGREQTATSQPVTNTLELSN